LFQVKANFALSALTVLAPVSGPKKFLLQNPLGWQLLYVGRVQLSVLFAVLGLSYILLVTFNISKPASPFLSKHQADSYSPKSALFILSFNVDHWMNEFL